METSITKKLDVTLGDNDHVVIRIPGGGVVHVDSINDGEFFKVYVFDKDSEICGSSVVRRDGTVNED